MDNPSTILKLKSTKILQQILSFPNNRNFLCIHCTKIHMQTQLLFFLVLRDFIIQKNTVSGKNIKNTINIVKLNILIFSNSQELPHYKLKSIKEYDFSFSRFRQNKLDKHYSNNIEQNTEINMQMKVRNVVYLHRQISLFFKRDIIKQANITRKQKEIGTKNVNIKLENPKLMLIKLFQERRQIEEKKEELSGLYNKIQSEKRVETASIFVSLLEIIKIQI
ncbi:hypothetical protein ABPG72_010203 [Tetrahymena utriculariae]